MSYFLLTGVDRKRYHEIKDEWFGNAEVFERQDVVEVKPASFDRVLRAAELLFLQERHRIDVDCRRTDRTQPLFANQTPSETMLDREKRQYQRYSTISPTPVEVGAQSPSNEHIDRLGSILLTYNFYEKDLGAPSFASISEKRVSADS
jgi:TBC1 domain family member 15